MKRPKPMGRVQIVADDKLLKAIDQWRRKQADLPSRSAAIRRLVWAQLEAEKK